MQVLIPSLPANVSVPARPWIPGPSPCAQLCLPKPRWTLPRPDKSIWFSTAP